MREPGDKSPKIVSGIPSPRTFDAILSPESGHHKQTPFRLEGTKRPVMRVPDVIRAESTGTQGMPGCYNSTVLKAGGCEPELNAARAAPWRSAWLQPGVKRSGIPDAAPAGNPLLILEVTVP